jgi:hypothetical protein
VFSSQCVFTTRLELILSRIAERTNAPPPAASRTRRQPRTHFFPLSKFFSAGVFKKGKAKSVCGVLPSKYSGRTAGLTRSGAAEGGCGGNSAAPSLSESGEFKNAATLFSVLAQWLVIFMDNFVSSIFFHDFVILVFLAVNHARFFHSVRQLWVTA